MFSSLSLVLLPSYVHVHARLLGRRGSPGGGPAAGPALRPSPGSFPALPARRGVPAGAAAGPPGSAAVVSDNGVAGVPHVSNSSVYCTSARGTAFQVTA